MSVNALETIAQAKVKYEEVLAKETNKAKDELFTALSGVVAIHEGIVSLGLGNVIHGEPKFAPLLKSLGLSLKAEKPPKPPKNSTAANRVDAIVRNAINLSKDGLTEAEVVSAVKSDKFTEEKIVKALKSRAGKWFVKKGNKYHPKG